MDTNKAEQWKNVVGFNGRYEVSSRGRVRRIETGAILKGGITSGYRTMCLSQNGEQSSHYVHRLVMAAFVGPCPKGIQVNHKNGNRLDSRLDNLEYVTPKQNARHAMVTLGRQMGRRGEDSGNAKLTDGDVVRIRELILTDRYSYSEIAEIIDTSHGCVAGVARGATWNHISYRRDAVAQFDSAYKRGGAKLTKEAVLEILLLLDAGQQTQPQIARQFGITQTSVSAIATGKTWGHVTGIKR